MSEIELIPPSRVDHYWPEMKKQLDRIPHTWTRMTKESIYERIQDEVLQVWGVGEEVIELVVMTQFVLYDTGRVLQVVHAFGSRLDFWLPKLDAMFERVAQKSGCGEIEIIGRKGWERKLESLGFEFESIVLKRKVKNWRMQ